MIRTLAQVSAVVAATVATAPAAADHQPVFRPEEHKGPPAGAPNIVLTLGTPHLDALPDDFRPATLAPLLDRLAAWAPTAIATENVSGLQCDMMRRYPARWAESAERWCFDPTAAGRAAGLDVPAANAEVERMLASWPAAPAAADRRRLALLFLAAGEPGSALVQWLRLPEGERRAADGLTAPLAAGLDERIVRRSETYLIAAPLAARLGLERLWSVDDHSADFSSPDEEAYGKAIGAAWDNDATRERLATDRRLQAGLGEPDGLMALYRHHNDPALGLLAYRSDFGAALAEPSGLHGRRYVTYWEVRNLRMVANIRDVMRIAPGTRMLAIVGTSHKAYYDAYLNQMHDVQLADTAAVLR